MKIAVDTSVLLLLLADGVPKHEEPERAAAEAMLRRRGKLWVPIVALTEALYGVPEPARRKVALEHERSGALLAFDAECARLTPAFGPPRASNHASRQASKWDHAIAASALRHGADVLCALDGDFPAYFKRAGCALRVLKPSEISP